VFGLKKSEIEGLKSIFKKKKDIQSVILFGSRAKGNYKSGSDIDLAIVADNFTLSELLDLQVNIDKLYLPYKVDLVDLSKTKNQDLKNHIKRVGIDFYKAEKG